MINKQLFLENYKTHTINELAKMFNKNVETMRIYFHQMTNYEFYDEMFLFGNIEKSNVICRALGYEGAVDYIHTEGDAEHRFNILPLVKKTKSMRNKEGQYHLLPLIMEGSKFCLYTPQQKEIILKEKEGSLYLPAELTLEEKLITQRLYDKYKKHEKSTKTKKS